MTQKVHCCTAVWYDEGQRTNGRGVRRIQFYDWVDIIELSNQLKSKSMPIDNNNNRFHKIHSTTAQLLLCKAISARVVVRLDFVYCGLWKYLWYPKFPYKRHS